MTNFVRCVDIAARTNRGTLYNVVDGDNPVLYVYMGWKCSNAGIERRSAGQPAACDDGVVQLWSSCSRI